MTLAARQTAATVTAATLIALSGALVMVAMIGPNPKDAELFVMAFIGAFLAGLRMGRYFGKPGGDGVLEAVIGAMLATLLGAVLAGVLLAFWIPEGGIFMILLAPFMVVMALASLGPTALMWVLTMGVTHLVMRLLRRWWSGEVQP